MFGQHQLSCVSALPGLLPGELSHFSVRDSAMVIHCPYGNAELLCPYLKQQQGLLLKAVKSNF